jgi:lauroyl/myristoyl acyltransferase
MDTLLYIVARILVAVLQALPLRVVARIGRAGGGLFYFMDARHRKVARRNLALSFPEKSEAEVRGLAKENFKRIGENFACAVNSAGMTNEAVHGILDVKGIEKFYRAEDVGPRRSAVFAIGHLGNFELYARSFIFVPGYKFATTYRGLRQPSLNRLLQSLREKSGCMFFERRSEADALKAAMNDGSILLGLLADQHGGDKGLRLKFFGRDCSTNPAPAVLALRYDCPLYTSIRYRVGLGRWRIEVGDEIRTHENGKPRPTADIMQDVNSALEVAVRRDPANWFWVHNRWKSQGREVKPEKAMAETSPTAE